jgi:creatinine amidohydrolase
MMLNNMQEIAPSKVLMSTITGGEARELYARNPVILLPMGSHEDQGPHMMMGDYLFADKIAELVARRATDNGTRTVVAPVLPFGGADWFGPMPGSIALSPATLTDVIRDMVQNLRRNGLTRIIIVNGHGGNMAPIANVTRTVFREDGLFIPCLSIWKLAYAIMPQIVGAEAAAVRCSHGSDPLTSVGLHLMPDLMRLDLIPDTAPLKRNTQLDLPFGGLGSVLFDGMEVEVPNEYDDTYHDGVGQGAPKLGSPETGAQLIEKLTEFCSRFVKLFADRQYHAMDRS